MVSSFSYLPDVMDIMPGVLVLSTLPSDTTRIYLIENP
jgi:hypothetical protein